MAKNRISPDSALAAEAFVAIANQAGCRILRRQQQFFLFDGVRYSEKSDEAIHAAVYRFLVALLGERMWPAYIESVVKTLGYITQIADETPLPSMLNGDERQYLAVANGLLDLDSLFSGAETPGECLLPHTSDWFSSSAMEVDFEHRASCPQWLDAIAEIMQGDIERIARLQEWFGYSLVAGNELKKVLLLYGERDTGKSTILNAYCDFLGKSNICCVPFEDLGQRFALAAMEGKLASVSFEISDGSRAAEGRLKTLSGGDAFVQFERKGKDAQVGLPTCKLAFATNNLPRITDSTSATLSRLLLLPCLRRFRGAEIDRRLRQKLQCELPGILNWALVGRYRLLKQGCFSMSAVCDKAIAEYGEECNPTDRFLRAFVVVDEKGAVLSLDLYARYKAWMQEHSFTPKNEANFGRVVRQVFPRVRRERKGTGLRPRYYAGITLGAGADAPVEPEVVAPVAAPVGLLGEMWERFSVRSPLLISGTVAPPVTQDYKVAGSDRLEKLFPTLGEEFRRGVDLANELASVRKLKQQYESGLRDLERRHKALGQSGKHHHHSVTSPSTPPSVPSEQEIDQAVQAILDKLSVSDGHD